MPHAPLRILLTEGSSLTSREVLTVLGFGGHKLDICDPRRLCISRFSVYAHRMHPCPHFGKDPAAYVAFISRLLNTGRYEVLLPVHEQAFLLASCASALPASVRTALPPWESILQVQGKVNFARFLERLGAPQPRFRILPDPWSSDALDGLKRPVFLKANYGTASQALWRVDAEADLEAVIAGAKGAQARRQGLLAQEGMSGHLERSQAIFNRGALAAIHHYRQLKPGMGGGDVVKESIARPETEAWIVRIGAALRWHGAIAFDCIWDEEGRVPSFIDCNPRFVEPVNAYWSGVDLCDAWLSVALGEPVPPQPLRGRAGIRTRMGIQALLVDASAGPRLRAAVNLLRDQIAHRGAYAGTREELLPVQLDPFALAPWASVMGHLLWDRHAPGRLSSATTGAYMLDEPAIRYALAAGHHAAPDPPLP